MITAHPLIQVHLIAPQLLLWIALPHHGDIMLATNYLSCRCYSVPFGQHAVNGWPQECDWQPRNVSRVYAKRFDPVSGREESLYHGRGYQLLSSGRSDEDPKRGHWPRTD